MNTIICPHCKKSVEISEAFTAQLEQEIISKEHEKHLAQIDEVKKKAEESAFKKAAEEMSLSLKDKENAAAEAQKKAKELGDELLERSRQIRELKAKDDEREREMNKKLEEHEEIIRKESLQKAEENLHSKLLEKDKLLQNTLRELETAKRQLTQGSQQLQGEAFEEEFEAQLLQHYPNDKILPVAKGVRGGDVLQEVWDSTGNYCGKILWELKNTKTWSEGWIDKVKADKRAVQADDAVIISVALPQTLKFAGYRNGAWVTERSFVFPLADTLRAKLIQLFIVKSSLHGKDVKMEALYSYLTGSEFKNRVEAIVEAFSSMQAEVEKERRYFENKWARDEKNIRQVIDNTYGMHGDLKGILKAAVPQIAGLDGALILDDGKTQEST